METGILSNNLLWVGFVLIDLSLAVIVYRFFGKSGLYVLIVASVITDVSDFAQGSMATIFGLMPRVAAGSMVAYLLSQHHDIFAFHFWKDKTKGRFLWLRNCASTMVSQAIDSVIFCAIALWGLFDTNTWLQILATTYFLKWFVAVIDTPFIYLAKRLSKTVVAKEADITLIEPQ
ncbi:queuosine precursor transporter [subsurface metagenome]